MPRITRLTIASIACLALLTACAYEPVPAYYPVTVPAPSPAQTFDRTWKAALAALSDTGVHVISADSVKGVIRGAKDQSEVVVTVARQADGSLQMEIEAKGPQGKDTGLASRISQAYQRRMSV